ncbi:MAG TPA: polymer-forming cytoskeletal protein, partial [Thermoplasmata archaeon]|nr:polymer-forming cytoskeletal protein [Thermoplasmata archaeon]
MADVHLERNSTTRLARVDGDLHVDGPVEVSVDGDGPLRVSGDVEVRGSFTLHGSLEARSLRLRQGTVIVEGALTLSDQLDAEDSEVQVRGDLSSPR